MKRDIYARHILWCIFIVEVQTMKLIWTMATRKRWGNLTRIVELVINWRNIKRYACDLLPHRWIFSFPLMNIFLFIFSSFFLLSRKGFHFYLFFFHHQCYASLHLFCFRVEADSFRSVNNTDEEDKKNWKKYVALPKWGCWKESDEGLLGGKCEKLCLFSFRIHFFFLLPLILNAFECTEEENKNSNWRFRSWARHREWEMRMNEMENENENIKQDEIQRKIECNLNEQ